jgi:hypothetical protein
MILRINVNPKIVYLALLFKYSGVSSKNKGKTVDMLIWCGIKNFYK